MPFSAFKSFVVTAQGERWFHFGIKVNCTGRKGAPVELLILGALRYLGRGWTLDDICEATSFSEEECLRVFIHKFIHVGSKQMFEKWVKVPRTPDEVADCMSEFKEAGFDGCIGSTDAPHVVHEKVSTRFRKPLGIQDESNH